MTGVLPSEVAPLALFSQVLRGFGFPVAPEQTLAFIAATGLLGPRDMASLRRAAGATFAPPPDRRAEFDALFRAFFSGEQLPAEGTGPPEDETVVKDDRRLPPGLAPITKANETGQAASGAELLGGRSFRPGETGEHLRRLRRHGAQALPRRRAFRLASAKAGKSIDLRRTLRAAVRHDGDAPALLRRKRRTRQRRVLLLIDVSGSMKAQTRPYLEIAHSLSAAGEAVEAFTFGTRLTRITRPLSARDPARALADCADLVDDWDGGTRIGDALQAFLAVPRFAAFARGAVVLILSDGLERGDHSAMLDAIRRLSRRAFRLAWLTPLAADPRFRPETTAMAAILPWLDDLADGGSVRSVVDYVLALGRDDGRWAADRWRTGTAA